MLSLFEINYRMVTENGPKDAVGGDPWKINGDERSKHDAQFQQLKPVQGFVTGTQARGLFVQSGLPMPILGQIWDLADLNGDGRMDRKEFSIAMHLIQKKLQGYTLPKTLPPSMMADPQANTGGMFGGSTQSSTSLHNGGGGGGGGGGGFGGSPGGFQANSFSSLGGGAYGQTSFKGPPTGGMPVAGFAAASPAQVAPVAPASSFTPTKTAPADGDWAVPQSSKLKYTQQFNIQDRSRKGFLTGAEARQVLLQTGVPHQALAQIWGLSDIDNDGKLSKDEYVLAMHLVDTVRSGQPLQAKLPPDLVPPRYRKGPVPGQAIGLPPVASPMPMPGMPPPPSAAPVVSDAFGDLLGSGFGGASFNNTQTANGGVAGQVTATEAEIQAQVTFEDRRKANFDKGQAELDKRRAALKEMQEKEEEARRTKEREEHEKRERKRMEQEMKKQQELDRQRERQMAVEAEREEQRRKAMEQKEAARREMERQRQLEWERQRRDQLMSEKQREHLLVDQLQATVSKLKVDLEAMDEKKGDAANRVKQARDHVTEITSSIDGMRSTRDVKLADIERCQAQIQEWSLKLSGVQQERLQSENQVQAITGAFDDTYRTVQHSYKSKKANIDKLKTDLQKMEVETAEKLREIDETNTKLNDIKQKLNEVQSKHKQLQAQRAEKKMAWLKRKGVKEPQQPDNNADWFSGGGSASNSIDQPSAGDSWGDKAPADNSWAKTSPPAAAASTATAVLSCTTNVEANVTQEEQEQGDKLTPLSPPAISTVLQHQQQKRSVSTCSSEKELEGLWAATTVDSGVQNEEGSVQHQDGRKSAPPKTLDDLWADFGSKDLFSNANAAAGNSDPFANHSKSADLFAQNNATTTSTTTSQSNSNLWGDDFFSSTSKTATITVTTATASSRPGFKKYQGLYQFVARNPDELSFNPGDTVWVKDDQTGTEPDWLAGEKDGQHGVFPAAYAAVAEDTTTTNGFADSNAAFGAPSGTSDTFFGSEFNPPASTSPPNAANNTSSVEKQGSMDSANVLTASVDSSFTAVSSSNAAAAPPPPSSSSASVTSPPEPAAAAAASGNGEALQALALYSWRAKKDNHLTFDKGDVINVNEQQDMWCSGELNGTVGWFPKSYVKLMGAATPVTTTGNDLGEVPPVPSTPAETPSNNAMSPTQESEYFVAIYTYTSNEPGDLTFPQGEVILVNKKDQGTDWWTGTVGDKTGIFPANYVKKMEGSPPSSSTALPTVSISPSGGEVPAATVPSRGELALNLNSPPAADGNKNNSNSTWVEEGVPEADDPVTDASSSAFTDSQTSSKQLSASAKKPEIASVIAAYQGSGQEQLSLQPGQLIQVRKKSPSGWWEGELQARGQKRKIGWFPANYVKLLGAGSRATPDASGRSGTPHLSASPAPGEGSRSATPVSYPAPTVAPAVEQVVALYNYQAQNDDELTFSKNSVINVVDNNDPDWWKGEVNGVCGLFPSNYVVPLSDNKPAAPSSYAAESAPMSPELEESEKHRQNLIHELIDSEEQYVTALNTVKDVFFMPMKRDGILTASELETMFINWKDIRMCNVKMNKAFRVRKRMCEPHYIHTIGDLLCQFLPHMSLYVRYCSCQLNAAALLQKKYESDPKFKESQKSIMSDTRTGGMPLSSFLLKPMQRITKYPMLIQKILEYTPIDHSDHANLEEALSNAQEICNQVNEGVRETENSERLEWIQSHVQCDGLSEKVVYNSVTNSLGPRKVLYTGSLYKTKSGKELVGFLFNDFLLLSQPQRSLGDMASVFSFDIKTNTTFKMYRTPLFLNEISVVRSPEEGNQDSFHVHHQDKVYSLRAISPAEREAWVKRLLEASKHYQDVERKKKEKANQAKQVATRVSLGRLILIVVEGCNLLKGDENVKRATAMGRVLVVILEGSNLIYGEDGKSDPYCEVSMGAQEVKTAVVPNSLNPKWNASMQFTVRDIKQDVLCITVYDRDLFTPDDFLGRTEIRIADIYQQSQKRMGPVQKRLKLLEVDSGEVVVKLTLQLFSKT